MLPGLILDQYPAARNETRGPGRREKSEADQPPEASFDDGFGQDRGDPAAMRSDESTAPIAARPGTSVEFKALFGDISIEESVLELYCRAARLTNILFRDKIAGNTTSTETRMRVITEEAH